MRSLTILIERIGRARLAGLALLLLAAFSWQLAQKNPPPPQTLPQGPDQRIADLYVKGLQLTTTDAAGVPTQHLSAAELRYFRADDDTELSDARLSLQASEGAPWQISAAAGRLTQGGELILLSGPVTVRREASKFNRALELQTRDLRLRPAEGYAETDEKVTVVSDQDRVEAVGLQAWLKHPVHIKFLAQVKARYVPR